jgi:hypothetical protein
MVVLLEVEPPQGVTDLIAPYQDNFAILEKKAPTEPVEAFYFNDPRKS